MQTSVCGGKFFSTLDINAFMYTRLLERRAQDSADRIFVNFEGKDYSYSEFNRAANRVARRLLEEGIAHGDVVAVLMQGSVEYLLLWFALGKIGAVEVPINTAYRGDILLHQLRTSAATYCVADTSLIDAVDAIADQTSLQTIYVNGDSANHGRHRDFRVLLEPRPDHDLNCAVNYYDIGGIIFTSGTTGPSKGVLLSYRYLTACGVMYAEINDFSQDDILMNFLPFFHVAAKNLTIGTLLCGGRMILQRRLSISHFMDDVIAHGITHFMGVGGICNMLLAQAESPRDAEMPLRTIYAVPDPDSAHHELERRFRCCVTSVYGSTEIGLPIWRGVQDGYRPHAAGKLSPYYELKIVDEFDNEVATGQTGEIVVRPKLPFFVGSGYVGMPEKTIAAWRNLWLHSGDTGRIDADGWFYFVDRKSDSMRRRGENISSFEVEAIIGAHPQVAEVIAVPHPSEIGEDEVRIFVILKREAQLNAEALFLWCAQEMPYFMVPRYIDIVSELPRTPTQKVEKYKLRSHPIASAWDYQRHGWVLSRSGVARTA